MGTWNSKPLNLLVSIDRLSSYNGPVTTSSTAVKHLCQEDLSIEDEFLEDIGQCGSEPYNMLRPQYPIKVTFAGQEVEAISDTLPRAEIKQNANSKTAPAPEVAPENIQPVLEPQEDIWELDNNSIYDAESVKSMEGSKENEEGIAGRTRSIARARLRSELSDYYDETHTSKRPELE